MSVKSACFKWYNKNSDINETNVCFVLKKTYQLWYNINKNEK
jgi:hypothetical protein